MNNLLQHAYNEHIQTLQKSEIDIQLVYFIYKFILVEMSSNLHCYCILNGIIYSCYINHINIYL